jgi:hypothetical protein
MITNRNKRRRVFMVVFLLSSCNVASCLNHTQRPDFALTSVVIRFLDSLFLYHTELFFAVGFFRLGLNIYNTQLKTRFPESIVSLRKWQLLCQRIILILDMLSG